MLGLAARAPLGQRLDQPTGGRRRIEKQDAAGFAAGILPGMGDRARHERAGSGTAGGDLVADHERELAFQDPGDLVAVAVQMIEARRAWRQRLLEHHDAFPGFTAEKLQRKRPSEPRATAPPSLQRAMPSAPAGTS